MKTLRFLPILLPLLFAPPAAAFDPWSELARYELRWEVDLSELPPGQIRLWLPTPLETFDQHVLDLDVDSPLEWRETQDRLGNRMLHAHGELEAGAAAQLVVRMGVVREPGAGLPSNEIVKQSPDDPTRHLTAHRRVPLDGMIAELGAQTVEGAGTDLEKIRALYDWVVSHMRYSKHGTGWGQGDAVWACSSRYGNCTDFHSVFLGMARSQGVPARFVMGVPIPPDRDIGTVGGYHCWAQAFEPGYGWMPLDASEAWKSKRFDAYFGRLPSDRVAFSFGRDLVLDPPQQGEPLNYFFAPYVEIDGRAVEAPPFALRFRRVPMQTAQRPAR